MLRSGDPSLLSTPSDTRTVSPRQDASFQDHGQFWEWCATSRQSWCRTGGGGPSGGYHGTRPAAGRRWHCWALRRPTPPPPQGPCPRISVEPRSPEPRKGPRQSPGNAIWSTPLRGVKLGSSSNGFASCVVQESEGSSGCRGEKLR